MRDVFYVLNRLVCLFMLPFVYQIAFSLSHTNTYTVIKKNSTRYAKTVNAIINSALFLSNLLSLIYLSEVQ